MPVLFGFFIFFILFYFIIYSFFVPFIFSIVETREKEYELLSGGGEILSSLCLNVSSLLNSCQRPNRLFLFPSWQLIKGLNYG